jgi:hypothetical protein
MGLSRIISCAKLEILDYLKQNTSCKRLELEKHVLHQLSFREKKDGTIIEKPMPIDGLAFILAYKELEAEGQIKIERPKDVPSPMTDFNTLFFS